MIGITIGLLAIVVMIIWHLESRYIKEIEELNEYIDEVEIANNYFYQTLKEVKDDIKATKTNKEVRERIKQLFDTEEYITEEDIDN